MVYLLARVYITAAVTSLVSAQVPYGVFASDTSRLLVGIARAGSLYGVAVTDVDGDHEMDWVIAGYERPNIVLKMDHDRVTYYDLTQDHDAFRPLQMDQEPTVAVCACDVDGDGREEIYFLNTNNAYSGVKDYTDKLFKWREGRYVDLFSDQINSELARKISGTTVACVDRRGTGVYSLVITQENENILLLEMDETNQKNNVKEGFIVFRDFAKEAGLDTIKDGRGTAIGPIFGTDGRSDILIVTTGNNTNGLFRNAGDGTFIDVAADAAIEDREADGRGAALADFNNDGMVDVVYGNWMGPHRLLLQTEKDGHVFFSKTYSDSFEAPSPVMTVLAADFDNDGNLEVFMNNMYLDKDTANNTVYTVLPVYRDVDIGELLIGVAKEPLERGTGAAVADIDNDGFLELVLSEVSTKGSMLNIFRVDSAVKEGKNHWIRVMPLTQAGAPARGVLVTLTLEDDSIRKRIIDGGSNYLNQMEPVAHFGLGTLRVVEMLVQWPDSHAVVIDMSSHVIDTYYMISRNGSIKLAPKRKALPKGQSCHIKTYTNYIIDRGTGCRSQLKVRQGLCAGGCERERCCCQASHMRYTKVKFRCPNSMPYEKRIDVSPVKCKCNVCL